MERIAVDRLIRIINSLSMENRLEVLSRLSESLKVNLGRKKDRDGREPLLDELFGAWPKMPGSLAKDVVGSRNLSV